MVLSVGYQTFRTGTAQGQHKDSTKIPLRVTAPRLMDLNSLVTHYVKGSILESISQF